MKQEEQFDLIYDERLSSQEQSTSTQSKQSNAQLSMIQDKTKNLKLKRVQKSLLHLNPIIPQRKGSQSCIEPFIETQLKQIVYTVYWYDENIDHKYEIVVKTSNETIVRDFIELVIKEFHQQNEFLHSPFTTDGTQLYSLYIAKKKNGKPNEDFPAFSEDTSLGRTNISEFALKITKNQTHYEQQCPSEQFQVNQLNCQIQEKKSFWQKIFFCCNFDV